MARYVVLYFEDNEAAELFCDDGTNVGPVSGASVEALVPAPTLFCDDPFGQHGNKKAGYFRGEKYGWWVCSICGKPTEGWGKSYAGVISSAHNLLTEKQEAPPSGWAQL